jgi:uncharacterized phage protein gp47/JayE
MGTYVTDDGFVRPTLAEIKADLETEYQTEFGEDIDLSPEGPFGQIIGIQSRALAQAWEALEEIYTSRDPSQATGISLDNIAAETGVRRIQAGSTLVENVLLYGLDGTSIPGTFRLRQPDGTVEFLINAATTISEAAARTVLLTPDPPAGGGGTIYTVTIDGTPYSYTSLAGDDEDDVVDALVSEITTIGAWAGTPSNESSALRLTLVSTDFSVSYSGTFSQDELASGADFTATETGSVSIPANTLTEIVTPVGGLDSANNPAAGITGRDLETDEEFRIRRDATLFLGKGTDEAIRDNLLNRVEEIQAASVTSNRTDSVDSEGRPPKSFEAVVVGGSDSDIAEVIWDTMPAGIASFGSESEDITDSEGRTQTINFSRPIPVYVHVRVSRDLYDEEVYPTDGDNEIKLAIVEWAEANQTIGVDVIYQRLAIPIYSVPGISSILIEVDGTPNPGDSPSYAEANIPIAGREIAEFSADRITVQDLTP